MGSATSVKRLISPRSSGFAVVVGRVVVVDGGRVVGVDGNVVVGVVDPPDD